MKTLNGRLFWKAPLRLFELCEAAAHTGLFIIFPSNYELVRVLGASGSMTECFNLYKTGKNSRNIFPFFSFLCRLLIQSCFVSPRREIQKKKKKKTTLYVSASYEWRMFCIVEYCTENCGVIWLYLFLKSGTHFEFWFVLNTVFLALLLDHVNVKTSK